MFLANWTTCFLRRLRAYDHVPITATILKSQRRHITHRGRHNVREISSRRRWKQSEQAFVAGRPFDPKRGSVARVNELRPGPASPVSISTDERVQV